MASKSEALRLKLSKKPALGEDDKKVVVKSKGKVKTYVNGKKVK